MVHIVTMMKKFAVLENELSDHDLFSNEIQFDGFERVHNNKSHLAERCHGKQGDIIITTKKIKNSSEINLNWEKISSKDNTGAYVCSICKTEFNYKHKLRNHERFVHGMHQFTCIFCNEGFQLKKQLITHVAIHKGVDGYKCNICYKVRPNYIMILRHSKTHAQKNIICAICGASFKTSWELKSHEIQHKKDRKLKCETCGLFFLSSARLRCHMKTHRSGNSYRCEICGKNFNTLGFLGNHKKLHFSEKPFKCQYCSLSFVTNSDRKQHAEMHETERRKPFTCVECGKEYSSSTSLAVHRIKLHSEREKYQCQYCKHKFKTKASIIEHGSEHAIERPHSCEQCLCRYKSKRELNRHQREKSHFGEGDSLRTISFSREEIITKMVNAAELAGGDDPDET